MNHDLVKRGESLGGNVLESIVLRGDLSGLSPVDRAKFYVQMCENHGLNPASQPFAYLKLNGKEVLYATRGATDQLAAIHKLNREIIDGPKIVDLAGTKVVYCVAKATHPNGRTETATATVPLIDPVNVLMKAETKAKRRVTLSILGLSLLDEMELETIPAAVQEASRQVTTAELEAAQHAEDDGADGSRAFAAYQDALATPHDATAIRRLYLALQDNLRAEGRDLAEFLSGDGGAYAMAHLRLDTMGLALTGDEMTALLAPVPLGTNAEDSEGVVLARWCDAILGMLAAFDAPAGDARVSLCAGWWIAQRGSVVAQGERVEKMVRGILARASAGMRIADIKPATSKAAQERLRAEVTRQTQPTPPDGPKGKAKAPRKTPEDTTAQGDAHGASSEPPADASASEVLAWWRGHLADTTSKWEVANSWVKREVSFATELRDPALKLVHEAIRAHGDPAPKALLDAVRQKRAENESKRDTEAPRKVA